MLIALPPPRFCLHLLQGGSVSRSDGSIASRSHAGIASYLRRSGRAVKLNQQGLRSRGTIVNMMLRTPPGKQKRPSPASSPAGNKMKTVQHSATVVEKIQTSSPSKKPRLPFGINVEEMDEPFSLRSLRRGSAVDVGHVEPYHQKHYPGEMPRTQLIAGHAFQESETEDERDLDWDNLRCSYKCRNLVKSDVLASLDAREKDVDELQSMLHTLEGAYKSSEEERKRLKKRIEVLEQNLSAANEREKAWHRQRLQESDKTEELIRTYITRCDQLEEMLQERIKKCAEAEGKVQALEARAIAAEEAAEREAENALREIKRCQGDLIKLQDDREYMVTRLDAEVEMEKRRVVGVKAESERLQSELDKMKGSMDKNLDKLKQEHQLIDVEIRNNALRTTDTAEADLIIKHLREELSQNEKEVREARKLKRFHTNVEILKEQVASEKLRADTAESALGNLADLELKVKHLESELAAWNDFLVKVPGVETRDGILSKIGELQREVVASVAKIGEANAEVAKLQTALQMAKRAKDEAETLANSSQDELVEGALNLKRAERKIALVTKERDGLKEILASYDAEEAVLASHQKKNQSSGLGDLSTPTKSKDLRIQQLEAALADAQQHAKLLGQELERGSSALAEQRQKAEKMALELTTEQERIKLVEREADQLRAEVSVLESKVGRGESNPAATKVLHMLINPESMARGDTEVQALRAKLQLHERQSDGCREEDSNASNRPDSDSVELLKQRVSALEKREVRYRQVFGNKIAVFREACGLIFGYKVQMNEEQDSSTGATVTLFTLRSIYSGSEDEQIQFQFKSGNLEMIANEYTSSPEIQRQVTTFLRNFKSIPAFIANLTMELFNKTTLG
ncbi:hypothetical protein R1sor_023425 [Riccia sorocarpa]|uniref:Mitotic spindle assembly checkpoint protein MAD1 n=1 Tax=Riccia sorocarpa TaxID=122646 RepID=A0ABD3GRS1_9MARC